jgi:hypothetical protein
LWGYNLFLINPSRKWCWSTMWLSGWCAFYIRMNIEFLNLLKSP